MASNYTENYQLPIWAADDAFLRTEFNDAHEKIDGAIWEASRVVKLADVTLTEASDAIVLSLAGVDLTDYCRLELWVPRVVSSVNGSVYLRLNDLADNVYCTRSYTSVTDNFNSAMGTIGVTQTTDGQYVGSAMLTVNLFAGGLCGRVEASNAYTYQQEYRGGNGQTMWGIHPHHFALGDLTHLTVQGAGTLLAGSRAVVLGFRI